MPAPSAAIPLSLLLFCSGKNLLDDVLGTKHPNAGFCGGSTGFDCICNDEDAAEMDVVIPASPNRDSFDEWYASLDQVFAQEEAMNPGVSTKANMPFVVDGHLVDNGCEDRNGNCSFWAEIGECQKNPSYILYECPKSCNVCRRDMPRDVKCQRDPAEPPIVQSPGGLNQMFERIIADPEIQRRYTPTVASSDPWIVVFENFATRRHWDFLEEELKDQFEGSTVVGGMDDNGNIERQTLNTRTSSNAWCNLDSCYKSEVHTDLQDRLIGILGPSVGRHHMEALQVLKYNPGEFYHPHHDTITEQIHSWAGPRVLNAFIYFNDKPEGGGETEFTLLDPPIKVKPQVGRMVLWASQKDVDTLLVDERTTHQACNVTSGTKEAANLWVHLYDFQTPSHIGC